MVDELETAGLASLGGLSPGGDADLSGQPCRNCGEMVTQRHCPRCGQLAASYHRPFITLVGESISDSLALDGRLARTLPLLFFRPGVLTRRYTEGKRARYVPPFRLFLLSSLIFYFVVFAFVHQVNWLDFASANSQGRELTEEEIADLRNMVNVTNGATSEEEIEAFIERMQQGPPPEDESTGDESDETEAAPDGPASGEGDDAVDDAEGAVETDSNADLEERVEGILEDPRLFIAAIESWLPRLSLLLVPLTMLTMGLMYAWRRRIYIYDHAVHALNLHSWMYLAATVAVLVGLVAGPGTASAIFFIVLPVYVTLSLRGAYQRGYFTSFLRMLFLSFVWLIGVSLLSVAVVITSALSV